VNLFEAKWGVGGGWKHRMPQGLYACRSQSVLRRSQGMRDQFPGDPWIHFCNGCFDVYLFLIKGLMLVKNDVGTFLIGDIFTSYDLLQI
jgi:hypothetical protein